MKTIILSAIGVAILAAADQPQTFHGVITDTMCGKTHGMVAGQPDDRCIAMCVKGSSGQYALYDGKEIKDFGKSGLDLFWSGVCINKL